jgi:predicted HTH transcriptional regulator
VDRFFQDNVEGPGIQMRDGDLTRKAMLRALMLISEKTVTQLKDEEPWKEKDFEALADTGVKKLIELGESSNLEFKSTARWDIVQQKADAVIEQVILKTVAGFLNSERGGTLLIGVEDNRNICGIEVDYQTFKNTDHHNCDAYERWLVSLLLGVIGKEFTTQIHPSFQAIDGKTICKLVIDPAPEPVFVPDKIKQDEIFYLRVGNATNTLGVKAAVNFYKTRWASRK